MLSTMPMTYDQSMTYDLWPMTYDQSIVKLVYVLSLRRGGLSGLSQQMFSAKMPNASQV